MQNWGLVLSSAKISWRTPSIQFYNERISEVPHRRSTVSSCHGLQSMIVQSSRHHHIHTFLQGPIGAAYLDQRVCSVSMFCRFVSLTRWHCVLPFGVAPPSHAYGIREGCWGDSSMHPDAYTQMYGGMLANGPCGRTVFFWLASV